MFSSKSNEWETPQDLFDKLNEFYHFNLDPASTDDNAKCDNHYTIEDDGLSKDRGGCNVFVNPPYGREIGKWVKKAYEESKKPNTKVVMLIPARTDTTWFHDYCLKGKLMFLRGRLKFVNKAFPSYREDGDFKVSSAPFPSMIVVFGEKGEEYA